MKKFEPLDQEINDNQANWDDRAIVHHNGGYGDLDQFIADKNKKTAVALRDFAVLKPYLPNQSVAGLNLLHLQCHIGDDTISWWRLGAKKVYGLDFSQQALNYAKEMATAAGASINYVLGDARFAAKAIPEMMKQFQVIVTSVGTITWLPKLEAWAQSIADLLAPGGVFMIRDSHPLLFALDNNGLEIVQNYFSGSEITYESDESYTPNSKGKIAHTKNHIWAHDFQEMISVLRAAGLVIETIGEQRISDWKSLPMLAYNQAENGWYLPANYPQIPLTFSIVARKPK